jgi:hypothetical protein
MELDKYIGIDVHSSTLVVNARDARVADVVVCDPRENRLVQDGSKGDAIDAGKLSHLLRMGAVKRVYHDRHGTATLKELVRSYDGLVEDSVRVMNRLNLELEKDFKGP